MEIHSGNRSRLPRGNAVKPCRYCGIPVEWYERYDGQWVPLALGEVPARAIPGRYQWGLVEGIAYPRMNDLGYCRLAHPAVCPAVLHTDLPPQLVELVGRLRARMERLADGGFVPDVAPHSEDEVRQPDPKRVAVVRHVLHYMSVQLAPCPIDEVRCVAAIEPPPEEGESGLLWTDGAEQESPEGELPRVDRCTNTIFDPSEGQWDQLEIPYAPGRAGQAILSASEGLMWVWSLQGLPFMDVRRWLAQRCETHHLSNVLDAVKPEWAHFDTLRHAEHILTLPPPAATVGKNIPAQRGGGANPPTGVLAGRSRQRCATDGCPNGTGAVEPKGWICYVCTRARTRRDATHRRHQGPSGR